MKRKRCAPALRAPIAPRSGAARAATAIQTALLAVVVALTGLGSSACITKKPYAPEPCARKDLSGCIIDSVKVLGNKHVSSDDIEEKIATVETKHGILGGLVEHVPILSLYDRFVIDYERFDPFVLERDLERIERYYRARGYYEAHARAGRVIKTGSGDKVQLRVEIVIDEGVPVKLERVEVEWKGPNAPKPTDKHATETRALILEILKRGASFEEQAFEDAKKKAVRGLTDSGFAYATIEAKADVDLIKHQAVAKFTIDSGPACTFGTIAIEGLGELPEPPMRRQIGLYAKRPYSTADIEAAQVALAKHGVLASIDVVVGTSPAGQPQNPIVPVTFRVHPAALRTLKIGGGLEIGSRVEVHGLVGWENRNFLGGLRRFLVEAKPALVLNPQSLQTLFDKPTWQQTRVLPEIRLRSELRQPGFLERRTDGVINVSADAYLPLSTIATTDFNAPVRGYLELAAKVGVERAFFRQRLYLGLFANIQHDRPFAYWPDFGAVIAGFDPFTIPYVEAIGTVDLRYGATGKPDPLNTHKGIYFTTDLQVATPFTGGKTFSDVRLRPEVRAYIPLARRWTLALRVTTGFLFPINYSEDQIDPALCTPQTCGRTVQLLQFRAFFSGGSSSNRGYPFAGVGPRDNVYVPDPSNPTAPPVVAVGGLSLWESSIELRAPVYDKLGVTLFVDASNVGRSLGQIFTAQVRYGAEVKSYFAPHLSTGIGIRYDTPIGPVRADFGLRVPCAQVIGATPPQRAKPCWKSEFLPDSVGAGGNLFGLPLALSIAIGEAF